MQHVRSMEYDDGCTYTITTGILNSDGSIGSGGLRWAATNLLVQQGDVVVKASAIDAKGHSILQPSTASFISAGRFDYKLPVALFDSQVHGTFKAYLTVYDADGTTLEAQYVVTCKPRNVTE